MTFWFCKHSFFIISLNVPSLLFSFSPPLEEQLTFLDASAGVRWTVLLTTVAKSVLTSILSMWNDVPFPTLPAIQQLLMVMDSYFWVLYGFWLISSHYFLQVLCRILSLELIELKSFPKMTFGFNDIYVPLTSAIYIYIYYIYIWMSIMRNPMGNVTCLCAWQICVYILIQKLENYVW